MLSKRYTGNTGSQECHLRGIRGVRDRNEWSYWELGVTAVGDTGSTGSGRYRVYWQHCVKSILVIVGMSGLTGSQG